MSSEECEQIQNELKDLNNSVNLVIKQNRRVYSSIYSLSETISDPASSTRALTPKQCREILQVSTRMFSSLIASGKIPFFKIGKKTIRIWPHHLTGFINTSPEHSNSPYKQQ